MSRRLPVLVAALALVAVVAVVIAAPRTSTATGVVVAVDSVSLAEVTVHDPDGRWPDIEFEVGTLQNGAEFPPGHLVEHIATRAAGGRDLP